MTGFVRRLVNLECAGILFSEFKALKVLEFPKLDLESLEFASVNVYLLRVNICTHNYGINHQNA